MTDKIPVFDNWGNRIGDFVRSGSGCGIGWILLGLPLFIAQCLPLIGPFITLAALIWLLTKPKDYPNRNVLIKICIGILIFEVLCICLFAFLYVTGPIFGLIFCSLQPNSYLCR